MKIQVSLVIATFNRAAAINRLLSDLPRQTLDRNSWEVIVVDDGSSDATASTLAQHQNANKFNLTYATQQNAGPSAARDKAIKMAQGATIVISDDDMELAPDFLAAHLDGANLNPGKMVVYGHVRPAPNWTEKPLFDAVGEFKLMRLHRWFMEGKVAPRADDLAAGNVSFPKALYLAVGGFDFSFRLYEDRELGYRFGLAGAEFVFSDKAWSVHHCDLGNYEAWRSRQYRFGVTSVRLGAKHPNALCLHPMAYLVEGNPRKRQLVLAVCRSATAGKFAVKLLTHVGFVLQRIGLANPAVQAYLLIETVEYHLGLTATLGTWDKVEEMIKDYQRLKNSLPSGATNKNFNSPV